MKTVNITLNSDGSFTRSQDKVYVEEHMAVQLVIALPESMCSGFDSYALCFDPSGLCRTVIVTNIGEPVEGENADAYYSEGVIYCTLPSYFTDTANLFVQAEARIGSGETSTYIEKSAVFNVPFEHSLTGSDYISDPNFTGLYDPESYAFATANHTHSYNSLTDLPELYYPDDTITVKFISQANVIYSCPDDIINPGTHVQLPAAATWSGANSYRRMYAWRTDPDDEIISSCGYNHPLPEPIDGTVRFYAVWSANYYNYKNTYNSIKSRYVNDRLEANSNDPQHEGESFAKSCFEAAGIDALNLELEQAATRTATTLELNQTVVDGQEQKLLELYAALRLKPLPEQISCSVGDTHTHDWKRVIVNSLALFGNETATDNISLTTPIPADCKYVTSGMETLRAKLVELSTVLTLGMKDMYRLTDLETFGVSVRSLYTCYHALVEKEHTVIDTTSTTVSITLEDGVEYKYSTLGTLSITAPSATHYHTRVTFSSGTTATVVAISSSVIWADGELPEIAANATYQIDVEDGLAVWREFYAAI